jgi:hypothetical protein
MRSTGSSARMPRWTPRPRRTWACCTRSPALCTSTAPSRATLLDVEILDIESDRYGYTVEVPISQLVDVPNMLVSAFLPEDIFTG